MAGILGEEVLEVPCWVPDVANFIDLVDVIADAWLVG